MTELQGLPKRASTRWSRPNVKGYDRHGLCGAAAIPQVERWHVLRRWKYASLLAAAEVSTICGRRYTKENHARATGVEIDMCAVIVRTAIKLKY